MRILLFISLLVFFSCTAKNTKVQTEYLQQDTVQTNNIEKVIHNDTNFVSVFLNIDYKGSIDVFDKPNGKIIKSLKNDFEGEDFVMFDLLHKNDSMFFVISYYSTSDSIIAKGWIHKSKYISIYTRANDAVNRPLILYKYPNNTSQIVAKDMEYNIDMYEVIDFEGRWLKIKAKINGKIYEGWIPPEMQCSNVYTTCT